MQESKIFFSTELLIWYEGAKRDLPWRRHRDPYYIWVSEIMLQQTRVDTVIPYFQRFIERFPTVTALSEAPEEDVLKCWEGLGYYSRARNLQAAATQVVERHGGIVPDNKAEVSALKGVGPYTTGAILSIAFNRPEPAVDGNVMRVLSRYFMIEEDIMKTGTRTLMEELAAELIPQGRASDFNQALMELGALICTPKSPQCLICPVMARCTGRLEGAEERLPVKTKAKPPGPAMDRLAAELAGAGVIARPEGAMMNAEHTFSHIHWNLRVFRFAAEVPGTTSRGVPDAARLNSASTSGFAQMAAVAESTAGYETAGDAGDVGVTGSTGSTAEYRWITRQDMDKLAFPNVFLKILNSYFQ
ncbi:A/G-specific adenine glycosylase [Paenibacillus senegalimassiliensis]|uniref:A/G-specific adenine glycosylase n=1 Tax=Paenibacillus senegalimassiliensis TaxID=1737426 RepID=UPI00073EC1A4|nr:A/G-specific adenine glycosylase [Paenibacillus senegalimassiliensis]